MESIQQMKDLLMVKDKDDNPLLISAALSKNAIMFNMAIAFVEQHLSSQEVISKSTTDL